MVAHHIAMMPVSTRVAFLVLVFGCVSVPVRAQLRLADASDRAAFRSWFVLLADAQFERPVPEVTDCAALIRFAFREALRAHTPEWARRVSLPVAPPFPDVRSAPTPDEGGWPLFRVSPGTPGRYAEFADARTLVRLNARRVSRDTSALQPAPDPIVITAPGREGLNSVRLVKAGGGTLYWSSRASFYDTQGAQTRSGSRQLAISRKYARLVAVPQRERIVYREQSFDGRMSPGDVLTIRLTVAGSKDWRYLMIEDPLPAGVEAIQDTTAYPMEREDRWRWWWGSQVEYRDNRTVFFQEQFDQGRYEFVYLVKAISSGEFRAVPAQIAPMYVPDVTASSEPQTVIVAAPEAGAK